MIIVNTNYCVWWLWIHWYLYGRQVYLFPRMNHGFFQERLFNTVIRNETVLCYMNSEADTSAISPWKTDEGEMG
jgi:hypothetical protein